MGCMGNLIALPLGLHISLSNRAMFTSNTETIQYHLFLLCVTHLHVLLWKFSHVFKIRKKYLMNSHISVTLVYNISLNAVLSSLYSYSSCVARIFFLVVCKLIIHKLHLLMEPDAGMGIDNKSMKQQHCLGKIYNLYVPII